MSYNIQRFDRNLMLTLHYFEFFVILGMSISGNRYFIGGSIKSTNEKRDLVVA